jgi:hypothetical protein
MKSCIVSSLIAATVVFFWGAFSWMVLPWHMMTFSMSQNDAEISAAFEKAIPAPGVYMYPGFSHNPNATKEEKQAAMEEYKAKKMRGMSGLLVMNKSHDEGMGKYMLISWITQFIGALLLAYLLGATHITSYWCKVLFVTVAAGTGAMLVLVAEVEEWAEIV